ncbi:glycosyltransferase family 2 protein [Desulfobacterota bacterium M19]
MKSHIKISVVIPVYNAEQYISNALGSVFAQTVQPLEIVVVDDGSTDATRQVLSGYEDRIHVITQDNMGPSAARNMGIRKAAGDFIAFLDADDEWLSTHLENANHVFYANKELVLYACSYKRSSQDGRKRADPYYYSGLLYDSVHSVITNYFLAQAQSKFNLVHSSTVVIKRAALLSTGGFHEEMRHGEDRLMWFSLSLISCRIGYSQSCGGIYKYTENSLTKQLGYSPETLVGYAAKRREKHRQETEIYQSSGVLLDQYAFEAIGNMVLSKKMKLLSSITREWEYFLCVRTWLLLRLGIKVPILAKIIINTKMWIRRQHKRVRALLLRIARFCGVVINFKKKMEK